MSGPPRTAGPPITDERDLVAYIAEGAKPPSAWRVGTEHEKFGFRLDDLRPIPYAGPAGVRAMLEGLMRFDWEPVYEGENVIALAHAGQAITLEPGGQFELSGAPLATLHETCDEVNEHLRQVKAVASEIGVGFLGLGFQPKWRREDIPLMPKGRYDIMRAYMPKRGSLGLDMMLRTCTVQANLDFGDEADFVRKMRIGLALQPVATAPFADSAFVEGRPSGFLSYRSHVWTDTDPDRSGMLPFVFEPGMGYERYAAYALDVPMYFVYREGRYIDASGQSFRDFLAGRLPALPGEHPRITDWENHLTTLFPEVRAKRYIEMRGADGGPWRRLCALPALWVGLLYDPVALDAAAEMIRDWTVAEIEALRVAVPSYGLAAPFRGRTVRALAREVLAIARGGLARRNVRNEAGDDETHFLDSLDAIVTAGRTPADALIETYETRWGGSVDPVFAECAY